MLQVLELERENFRIFQPILLPAHLQKLQHLGNQLWGVGIVHDHQPVGVALMETKGYSKQAHVFYFTVRTGGHQVAWTQQLLEKTTALLAQKHRVPDELDLQLEQMDEKVLAYFLHNGWGEPVQPVTTCICDMRRLTEERWVTQSPDGRGQVIPWSSVSQREWDRVSEGVNKWYPLSFSPLVDSYFIDRETSFAFRYEGEIAGWIICERVASNMLLCRSLFVRETGRAAIGVMQLVAEITKVVAANDDYAMFVVEQDNQAMMNLMRKRLEKAIIRRKHTLKFRRATI